MVQRRIRATGTNSLWYRGYVPQETNGFLWYRVVLNNRALKILHTRNNLRANCLNQDYCFLEVSESFNRSDTIHKFSDTCCVNTWLPVVNPDSGYLTENIPAFINCVYSKYTYTASMPKYGSLC